MLRFANGADVRLNHASSGPVKARAAAGSRAPAFACKHNSANGASEVVRAVPARLRRGAEFCDSARSDQAVYEKSVMQMSTADRCDAVIEVAEAAGAGAFVGLDLYTEVIRPGWRRFPVRRAEED